MRDFGAVFVFAVAGAVATRMAGIRTKTHVDLWIWIAMPSKWNLNKIYCLVVSAATVDSLDRIVVRLRQVAANWMGLIDDGNRHKYKTKRKYEISTVSHRRSAFHVANIGRKVGCHKFYQSWKCYVRACVCVSEREHWRQTNTPFI